ncbi:MAG: hypothetical protein JWP87_3842, partial [Labilithrix sp.]|nr:hypothetical protein [Labilithrix sp.]
AMAGSATTGSATAGSVASEEWVASEE